MKKTFGKILLGSLIGMSLVIPAGLAFADQSTTALTCTGPKTNESFFPFHSYTCPVKDSQGKPATQTCTNYGGEAGNITQQNVCTITSSNGERNTVNDVGGGTTIQQSVDSKGNLTSGSVSSPLSIIAGWFLGGLAWAVLKVATFVVWMLVEVAIGALTLLGLLLNFIVEQLVFNMGHFVTSSSATGIQTAWKIMRDLANIGIIGGLIAVAISTILQIKKYSADQLLARLIIAALLVNFSYFFAGAIIDSSNFLATAIYKNLICGTDTTCANVTFAGRFQEIINAQTTLSLNNLEGIKPLIEDKTGGAGTLANGALIELLSYILFLVLTLITIFVFLSIIALLLARFVVLILLLITSPVGIAGGAIPGVGAYAKEWWTTLFSQAFFAPVFFLLAGFSFIILDNFKGTTAFVVNSSTPFGDDVGVILTFAIATIFMLQSLRIAKQMSASERFKEIYQGTNALVGWVPRYLSAVGARQTVGWAADRYGIRYREWASKHADLLQRPVFSAADRLIQQGFTKVGDQKVFGYAGFKTEKEASRKRGVELENVQREQEALKKINGNLRGKARKKFEQLIDKQRRGELTAEEQKEMNELLKKGGMKHTAEAANARLKEERDKGDRERWLKKGEKTGLKDKSGRDILAEKDRRASDAEFLALQELRNHDRSRNAGGKELDWGRRVKRDSNGNIETDKDGNYQWENYTAYRQRIQKLEGVENYQDIDPETGKAKGVSWRNAKAAVEAEGQKMPDGWLERLYDKDPRQVAAIAPYLSHEQYSEFLKNATIKRSVKNAARDTRFGDYKNDVEKLENDVESGKVLYGGEEYNARALELFNVAKKDIKYPDEWVDYITSSPGEHLREMAALWDGSTTGFYKEAKDSGKIGAAEMRNINKWKRRRMFLDPQYKWTGAKLVLGNDDEVPPAKEEDAFDPVDDAKRWAEKNVKASEKIIADFNDEKSQAGKHIAIADKEKAEDDLILARLVQKRIKENRNIDDLSDAEMANIVAGTRFGNEKFRYNGNDKTVTDGASRKKFLKELTYTQVEQAEKAVGEDFPEGKQIDEVATMMQDKSLLHPVLGTMSVDSVMDVPGGQDIRFDRAWLDNKLVSGSQGEIADIIRNDNISNKFPWPDKKRIIEINKRRKKRLEYEEKRRRDLGLPALTPEQREEIGGELPLSSKDYLKNLSGGNSPESDAEESDE